MCFVFKLMGTDCTGAAYMLAPLALLNKRAV
jgi:hypothetical protein